MSHLDALGKGVASSSSTISLPGLVHSKVKRARWSTVAFLIQNYNYTLSGQQRKGSADFAVDIVRFVSGEEVSMGQEL